MATRFVSSLSSEEQQERALLREDLWNLMEAKTLNSVQAMQQRLREWLTKHPDDYLMWEAGEPLAMLEDAMLATKQELVGAK